MTDEEELTSIIDAAETQMRALGWMPIKTLILADVVLADGVRNVCIATSNDMRSYDSLGLLHYAIARENAGIAGEVRDE